MGSQLIVCTTKVLTLLKFENPKELNMTINHSKAVLDVLNERARQIGQENYSAEHDDQYQNNELLRAGVGYAEHVVARGWVYSDANPEKYQSEEESEFWPWPSESWKPKNPRADLVRAAALLIAEIERIDRASEGNAE